MNYASRDVLGGFILFLFGILFSLYVADNYALGSFRRLGSGMFPMILGISLSILGAAMIVPALMRSGRLPRVDYRSAVFVLLSIGVFALTVRPLGLIPAIVGLVVVSSLAQSDVRPASVFGLCAALSLGAFLIFRVGLGMPLPMLRWGF